MGGDFILRGLFFFKCALSKIRSTVPSNYRPISTSWDIITYAALSTLNKVKFNAVFNVLCVQKKCFGFSLKCKI